MVAPPPHLLRRETELAELRRALAQARDGGTLTIVAGAAGVGKSTLLAAAAAAGDGAELRRARGTPLEQELPFGVVRQLLEPPLRALPAAARAELLSGAAAPAGRVLADDAVASSAGGDAGFATLHGLYWLVAGLAARAPLVLLVDDLHWCDAPSARALAYLAARLADIPVALVAGVRTGEPSPVADAIAALEAVPDVRRVELVGLDAAATAELVRTALPEAGDGLCAAWQEATGGNPLLVNELLRTLARPGAPAPSLADVREAALTSVGDRARRRLDALGADAVALAEAMTALGMSGRLADAASVADLDASAAATAAQRMQQTELLAAADPFEWIHPLVQRSLYDGLTVAVRDRLHHRAAATLAAGGASPGRVAAHLAALRPAGSEEVVAGLLAAAEEAIARDAPEDAAAMVTRALAEQAPQPSRAELLVRLGRIHVWCRDPAGVAVLEEALPLLDDPSERAMTTQALGELLVHVGEWEAAAELVDRSLAELDGTDPALSLELDVTRALVAAFDPVLADGFWHDRNRLLTLSVGDSWPAHALCALLALTGAYGGEHPDEVTALVQRAVAGDVLLSQRGAGAWTTGHILGALTAVDALDRADALADEVEAAARAQSSTASALVAEGHRGWSAARRGDLARAEELMRPIEDTAREHGMLLILVTAGWYGRDLLLERPSQDDVAALLDALPVPPSFEQAAGGGWLKAVRGRIRCARGETAAGIADLRAAGAIFDRLSFGPVHDPWRSTLALALGADEREEALSLVDAELARADASGIARPRAIALRARGLLRGGDEGVEQLRASVGLLEAAPARYEHARSLVALGGALRRSGRRADAREPLAAGLELAFGCGAERLTATAREELVACGARPRRIERSGFAALTASERRVVRLAADERSNPEIAQALYLSVKTVERHLSNAYAKLEIAGPGARARLAAVLPSSGAW